LDKLIESIFPPKKNTNKSTQSGSKKDIVEDNPILKDLSLKEQVKKIIEMPDEEYSEKKLTSKLREYISEVEKHYSSTITDYKTHISPSFWEFKTTQFNVS